MQRICAIAGKILISSIYKAYRSLEIEIHQVIEENDS